MQAKDASKQAGAYARSAALTPERRSRIAAKAALKKAGIVSATHTGAINIGGAEIPCAVLEDGRRVVWQREVVGLLTGNKKGGAVQVPDGWKFGAICPSQIQNREFRRYRRSV